MKSAFLHLANLEAARDDRSMNLNYYVGQDGGWSMVVSCHPKSTLFASWFCWNSHLKEIKPFSLQYSEAKAWIRENSDKWKKTLRYIWLKVFLKTKAKEIILILFLSCVRKLRCVCLTADIGWMPNDNCSLARLLNGWLLNNVYEWPWEVAWYVRAPPQPQCPI